MQCPVCKSEAENRTPETLPAIVLACTTCGHYRISGVAYEHLARLGLEQRVRALDRARRASRHGLPMIDLAAMEIAAR